MAGSQPPRPVVAASDVGQYPPVPRAGGRIMPGLATGIAWGAGSYSAGGRIAAADEADRPGDQDGSAGPCLGFAVTDEQLEAGSGSANDAGSGRFRGRARVAGAIGLVPTTRTGQGPAVHRPGYPLPERRRCPGTRGHEFLPGTEHG